LPAAAGRSRPSRSQPSAVSRVCESTPRHVGARGVAPPRCTNSSGRPTKKSRFSPSKRWVRGWLCAVFDSQTPGARQRLLRQFGENRRPSPSLPWRPPLLAHECVPMTRKRPSSPINETCFQRFSPNLRRLGGVAFFCDSRIAGPKFISFPNRLST